MLFEPKKLETRLQNSIILLNLYKQPFKHSNFKLKFRKIFKNPLKIGLKSIWGGAEPMNIYHSNIPEYHTIII